MLCSPCLCAVLGTRSRCQPGLSPKCVSSQSSFPTQLMLRVQIFFLARGKGARGQGEGPLLPIAAPDREGQQNEMQFVLRVWSRFSTRRRSSLIFAHSTPHQCPKAFIGAAAEKLGYPNSVIFPWTFGSSIS